MNVAALRAHIITSHTADLRMVLPLLALPAELQASVMRLVSDVTTAGRLAQASRVCGQHANVAHCSLSRVSSSNCYSNAIEQQCGHHKCYTSATQMQLSSAPMTEYSSYSLLIHYSVYSS